jgi:hypothetical protein
MCRIRVGTYPGRLPPRRPGTVRDCGGVQPGDQQRGERIVPVLRREAPNALHAARERVLGRTALVQRGDDPLDETAEAIGLAGSPSEPGCSVRGAAVVPVQCAAGPEPGDCRGRHRGDDRDGDSAAGVAGRRREPRGQGLQGLARRVGHLVVDEPRERRQDGVGAARVVAEVLAGQR